MPSGNNIHVVLAECHLQAPDQRTLEEALRQETAKLAERGVTEVSAAPLPSMVGGQLQGRVQVYGSRNGPGLQAELPDYRTFQVYTNGNK